MTANFLDIELWADREEELQALLTELNQEELHEELAEAA
jgi:hypothetical protein